MIDIEKITASLKDGEQKDEQLRYMVKPCIKISREEYDKLLLAVGNRYLQVVGRPADFIIPDYAGIFYEWMVNDDYKGISLTGPVGCGKTTMLRAFYNTYNIILKNYKIGTAWLNYAQPKIITGKELARQVVKEETMPLMDKACIFLDDIGREGGVVNNFGTIRYPLTEWMLERDYFAVPVFTTLNTDFKALADIYGIAAVDRLISWTSIVTVTGKSKR